MKNSFKKQTLFVFLILAIVILLAFRYWFTLQPICYGDCLYFYPRNLISFWDVPFVWDNRGGYSGLGNYTPMFLYMYLPSLIIGFLYQFFHLTYNISEKIVWFFPFLIFSVVSIYKLTKVLKFSLITFMFASIFYLLNTYILLVVDGGQVGIALAYAVFPLSFALLVESLPEGKKSKLLAGLVLAALGVFDIRIAFFALGTFCLYGLFYCFFENQSLSKKYKSFLGSILVSIVLLIGIHFYWILPTIVGGGVSRVGSSWGDIEQLEYLSWMNLNHSLFVFQPHWYKNVFGKLQPVQFEFFLVPILVFLPLVFRKTNYKILSFIGLALLFTFFTKGVKDPFPEIYRFLFTYMPGFNFIRDPTKFLIPQLMTYSILIGVSIGTIYQFLKPRPKIAKVFLVLCLSYLLILVRQIFYPGLTGTFKGNSIPPEYFQIKSRLENDATFYRTLWYPGKDQFSYQDANHPRINATNDLVNVRPLNVFIEGTYDSYSYLKYSFSRQIFDVLGIRYVYMSDQLNKPIVSKSDKEDKIRLEKNLDDAVWLNKQKKDKISLYENVSYSPRIFAQNRTFWIIGSDDLYRTFADYPNFQLRNIGFVFLDEVRTREELSTMQPTKDVLLFNNKDESDLTFLLLDRRYFYNAFDYINKEKGTGGWGKSDSNQLIYWRNILENRGFRNLDFDLGKGFVWTDSPATMVFPIRTEKEGRYEIYVRFFANSKGSTLNFMLDNNPYEIKTQDPKNNFIWRKIADLPLSKGEHKMGIESRTGLNIINVIAVLPEGEVANKLEEVKKIEDKFEVVYIFDPEEDAMLFKTIKPGSYKLLFHTKDTTVSAGLKVNDQFFSSFESLWRQTGKWFKTGELKIAGSVQMEAKNIDKVIFYPTKYNSFDDFFVSQPPKVEFEYINPTKYKVKIMGYSEPFMLVFSENFHPLWELILGDKVYKPVPIYSTINGFNIDQSNKLEGEISFSLQNYIKPGILVSVFILLITILVLIL